MTLPNSEQQTALAANVSIYDAADQKDLVAGAPHLKHQVVAGLYESLVGRVVSAMGREPGTLSVLELGAGDGLAATPWFAKQVQFTAVDTSQSMLDRLYVRAKSYGGKPQTILLDASEFLESSPDLFDVVCHVSMLHHVPDYLALIRRAVAHIRPGGSLLTFQDPLRYDRIPRLHHWADRLSYFAWRITRGNYRQGLRTRIRRLRGIYSPTEEVDYGEYHVVRNGVDSDAIVSLLRPLFESVSAVTYWSTQARWLQSMGRHLGLKSSFAIVAIGRKS